MSLLSYDEPAPVLCYDIDDFLHAVTAAYDPATGESSERRESGGLLRALRRAAPLIESRAGAVLKIRVVEHGPLVVVFSDHHLTEGRNDDRRWKTVVQTIVRMTGKRVSTLTGPSFPRR